MSAGSAPAALRALRDADAAFPGRSRASDGIMGDARHQAGASDHNTGDAFDLTVDHEHGVEGADIAAAAKLDPRTKYVIFDRRIWNPSISPEWRAYHGANPHTHHVHVSIRREAREDATAWPWAPSPYEDDGGGGAKLAACVFVLAVGLGLAWTVLA